MGDFLHTCRLLSGFDNQGRALGVPLSLHRPRTRVVAKPVQADQRSERHDCEPRPSRNERQPHHLSDPGSVWALAPSATPVAASNAPNPSP